LHSKKERDNIFDVVVFEIGDTMDKVTLAKLTRFLHVLTQDRVKKQASEKRTHIDFLTCFIPVRMSIKRQHKIWSQKG
jgi:hypothetical protein